METLLKRVTLNPTVLNNLKATGFNFVLSSFTTDCFVRKSHCTTPLVKGLKKEGLNLLMSSAYFCRKNLFFTKK